MTIFRLQCLDAASGSHTDSGATGATATTATGATPGENSATAERATTATGATGAGEFPSGVAQIARVARSTAGAITCAGCRHFEHRPSGQPDGYCSRYGEATWRSVAFSCWGYQPSDLEWRRQWVEQQLRRDAALRIAADVANAPLLEPKKAKVPTSSTGETDGTALVSIMVAARTQQGIVSGELQAPRERFDAGEFFKLLEQGEAP